MVSLAEAERGWIPLRFDAGVGAIRAQFKDTLSRFGRLHTFVPGQVTLPLLSTSTTPTDASGLKTDYAAMIEMYINSAWQVFLAKGERLWSTTGATWTFVKGLTGAQGRQLIDTFFGATLLGTPTRALTWIAGAGAYVQYSTDGTVFNQLTATYPMAARCGWCSPAGTLYVIKASDNKVYYRVGVEDGAWSGPLTGAGSASVVIPPATATGVIPLGHLSNVHEWYLANGPHIWAWLKNTTYDIYRISTPLADITAACALEDEFVITDGLVPVRWHPTRPPRPIPMWPNGCPANMKGKIKSLRALNSYLLAYYELDAGGTLIFWGRPTRTGMDWHCTTATLTGGFPLSIGGPFVVSEQTVAGKRRVWTCTATGTAAHAYWQDWPSPGFDPLDDSTLSYEDGWLYLYSPRFDLIEAGDFLAELTRIGGLAYATSTEQIKLEYRPLPDLTAEESASWLEGVTFTFGGTQEMVAERPSPVSIQFRLGMTHSAATATPVLYNLFVGARERQSLSGLGQR